LNQHIFKVNLRNGIDKTFFYFATQTKLKEMIGETHGSTMKHITKDRFEALSLALPPLPIQKQIADILEKADAAREKRRQANQLTEQFLQSAFLEMFGDPVTNAKGWEVSQVEEVTRSHDSRRIPLESSIRERRHGKFPYYGASGVIDYIDDFIFDFETVLIGEDGANLFARSTPIAFIANGRYWVNNHAHVLTPNDSMTREYLVFFLNRTDLKPYISGSAQPKLTAANLSRIPISVPPIHEQQKFTALVEKVESLRAKQRESEKELENLFNSLMQRAFKGELEFTSEPK
jgi:type I restriction enzyme, S subunit